MNRPPVLAIAVTMLAFITGCEQSSEADPDAESATISSPDTSMVNDQWLVGTWGCALRESREWAGGSWIFHADGTYHSRIGTRPPNRSLRDERGTWTLEGDTITLVPTTVNPGTATGPVALPIEDATEDYFNSRWDNESMTMLRQTAARVRQ